ncbi:MAG: CbiX/SirB N-terminal domain-containing protein [Gammaproteobacteria bacterium]|jgi:sirohydrochlorin ferrochelatase|nr:CbiX/SirB N-terminal domain-containing protein [Gammaproteobacteria bacterium]
MKQLLIVAHGSRRAASNKEVVTLASKVADNLQTAVEDVAVAFLEFAEPSIGAALDDCFKRSVEEVVVLPYFLSAGNHVTNDIPRQIDKVQNKWPDKVITILPHVGASGAMVGLLAQAC